MHRTVQRVQFTMQDEQLAGPIVRDASGVPVQIQPRGCQMQIEGLKAGRYELKVDGKTLLVAEEKQFRRGINIHRGPQFEQAEALRQAILKKNELFFNRSRPQNETYLFGFRKHEQGQNAKEIPMFDPLIEKQEAEIAKLRKPKKYLFELSPTRLAAADNSRSFGVRPSAGGVAR